MTPPSEKETGARREDARRRDSVAAIRKVMMGPPVWTAKDVAQLNRIIREERLRSLADFRDPMERRARDASARDDDCQRAT